MNRTARIEIVPSRVAVETIDDRGFRGYHTRPSFRSDEPHLLRLRASNGAIVAQSEIYPTRSNARRAAGAWLDAMWDVTNSPAPVREVSS